MIFHRGTWSSKIQSYGVRLPFGLTSWPLGLSCDYTTRTNGNRIIFAWQIIGIPPNSSAPKVSFDIPVYLTTDSRPSSPETEFPLRPSGGQIVNDPSLKKCRAHSSAEGEQNSEGVDILCVYASCREHAVEGYIQHMNISCPTELQPAPEPDYPSWRPIVQSIADRSKSA